MGNKIFEYTRKDSYGIDICKMIIRYCEEENVEYISYENEEESGIYTIDKEDLNDIFSIIDDNTDLFDIESVEEPPVFDGFINEFYFSNLKQDITIKASNLDYYVMEMNIPDEAALLLEIFEDISEILERNDIELTL